MLSQWPDWDHKSYTVEDLAVGQIRFDNGATWQPTALVHDANDHMVSTKPDWLPSGPEANAFARKMRNFVDHVLYGQPTMATGEHGLMVQKMLDGIYQSAEKGREVAIK